MRLTIKQLRTFVTVAELESFSQAAQRLHLTPGAISLVIRDLESELGFTLFDRTTRHVALSKSGRGFLAPAHKVLRELQAAEMTARDLKTTATGVVRVAAPLVVASSLLPRAMAAYRKHHAAVVIRPIDCTVENLVRIVEEDDADLALGPDRPTPDGVRRIRLFDSAWVLWCARQHPLAGKRRITWSRLRAESVVAAGRDYETRVAEAFQNLREEDRFVPAYVVENITTALGIAAAGLGVTLAPAYVSVIAKMMGLVMKRVEDPELIREFSLYVSTRRSPTPAIESFLGFLESAPRVWAQPKDL